MSIYVAATPLIFLKWRILLGLLLLLPGFVLGQGSTDYGKGLKLQFDEVDSKFIRFVLWNQFWAGPVQHNPGTIINGESSDNTFLYGARRMRVLAHTQISPRYLIVVHFGINNHTFASGGASGTSGTGGYGSAKKPQIFFHDVYNEYAIIPATNPETGAENPFNIYAGAGLHYWNGVSRLTSGSTLNMLMVDAPVFNWPLVDVSDQFGRQFGVYVKGGYKKLQYQFHANKPFVTGLQPVDNANIAVDSNGDPNMAFGGYVDYQFLEKESQVLPYRVGTYVGTKKVLNVGAGFYNNRDATKSSAQGAIETHAINLLGLDVFADIPIGNKEKNMAITAYAVYYNFDFGPNYLRTAGICNPGVINIDVPHHERVLEGAGNSRVLLGTGQKLYIQSGFLLPRFGDRKLRIQPVGALALKDLQYLNETGTYWDAGANIFIDGHHAKLTVQYSSRPLYDSLTRLIRDRKGELVLQFQVYL